MPFILDFRKPQTRDDVAQFLGLQPSELTAAIAWSRDPDEPGSPYARHRIPKRRKGSTKFRIVWDIQDARLRDAHRAFAWRFDHFARDVLPDFPNDSTYGYVRGRSIKDNAARHCGNRLLLRCDVRDFFSTISLNRLAARFIQMGIGKPVAEALAGFATIERKLALGLNASPMLANLVCCDLDRKLHELAVGSGCIYTRYADDIAISGQALPMRGKVVEIVEAEGFRLSATKMRVTTLGQAHFVTGLSVSDAAGPHVPRHFKKRLRQELFYCQKYGIENHLERLDADKSPQSGINRIDGSVRFVYSIEPSVGASMRESWRRSLVADSVEVTYGPVHDRTGLQATFLFDEAEFKREDKRFLAVACVTTENIEKIRRPVEAVLRQHLMDPFSSGKKKALEKKGLHFTDAPESLRNEYAVVLPYLQFRAYIAFAVLDGKDYRAVYTELVKNLLPRRLKSYDRSQVTIYFEENPSLPETHLKQLVRQAYSTLETTDQRRPVVLPTCEVRSKNEEPAFSLPDALLWIFARTFAADEPSNSEYLRFERLRDRYRHIINVDTGELFSRRHPIELRRSKTL